MREGGKEGVEGRLRWMGQKRSYGLKEKNNGKGEKKEKGKKVLKRGSKGNGRGVAQNDYLKLFTLTEKTYIKRCPLKANCGNPDVTLASSYPFHRLEGPMRRR